MLMLSKKVEYGLMSVLYLSTLADDEVVSVKELSDRFNLPAELLGKVMQSLSRSGWVEAVQGSRGGYRLHKSFSEMTLGGIIECLEGPVRLARCLEDPAQCGQFRQCNIKGPMHEIHERLNEFIHGIPLVDFKRQKVQEEAVHGGV